MEIRSKLTQMIQEIVGDEAIVHINSSSDLSKGDFTTNIAMRLDGKFGKPMEAAEKLKDEFEKSELSSLFAKVEVLPPGFINLFLSEPVIIRQVERVIGFESENLDQASSMIIEFGDLNPFKEPHIGHLRNLALGESISRMNEFAGVEIIRANYEGDVGLHVGKAIWGITKLGFDTLNDGSLEDKAKFLGKAYAEGAQAFENDESAKLEIIEINKKVYAKDQEIMKIWKVGREVSLEYFETLYKKLGVKYDKYYFESETADEGKKIVNENTPKVFETDAGAIIFRGENFGLHTRVFITKDGNPMYEAKDLGLAFRKDKDFPAVEKSIIMTANEQVEYFKVLLSALGEISPEISQKTSHLSYGFVNLKEGKMSSRTGNVISAFWLLEETRKKLREGFKEVNNEVLEQLAVGSVKWSMLRFSRDSSIAFSIDESIQIEGNSGPYMLYSYARIQSLLAKSDINWSEAKFRENIDPQLVALARLVCQFETVVKTSGETFSPHLLTNYLYTLAQNLNQFYEKEKVIGSDTETDKILMINAVGKVLKKGLELLGIEAPVKI